MALKDDPRRLDPAAYPFRLIIQPRYGDMDPNHHLNNVALARMLEEARVRFQTDLRQRHPEIGRPRLLVAHVAIDYLAEGHYPGDVDARLAILAVGGASYRIGQALFQAGRCILLADSVLVHRNPDGSGSATVPAAFRSALEGSALG